MKMKWQVLDQEVGFQGFFRLVKYKIRHELFGGGWGAPIERELLERGHAAAVLPYDAALDSTLLIEQFRAGAMNDKDSPWLLEFIAGMVEEGESGEDVVRREAMEEAGIKLEDVHYITTYYPTPGGCSETISLYWAPADLSQAGGHFGLPTEGEDIRAFVLGFEDALALVDNGKINNSLAIILLLWFERLRLKMTAKTEKRTG